MMAILTARMAVAVIIVVLFLWLGEKGGVQASSALGPRVRGRAGVAALTLHFALNRKNALDTPKCATGATLPGWTT